MMEKRNKIYGHQARNVIDDDEIKLKILANTTTTTTNFQENVLVENIIWPESNAFFVFVLGLSFFFDD